MPETTIDAAKAKFDSDTEKHELSVLHDDGLYRHLRCQGPETWIYGFDVVTWPGYLAIVGDAGDYLFSRVRDMFEFFTLERGGINPQYWGEKLQGPCRDSELRFSPDAYTKAVKEAAKEHAKGFLHPNDAVNFLASVNRDLLSTPPYNEQEANARLSAFGDISWLVFDGGWGWREFDPRFLWCCHAIVWAIKRYRSP